MEENTTDGPATLSPDSTLRELFQFFSIEDGVRVVPMTVKEAADDTQLLLVVRGDHTTASLIFAEVVNAINNLNDMAAQAEAAADGDEPRIITS